MGRIAKPWYRADRDEWCVWHEGKQVPLAKGRANGRAARDAFHRLKAEAGKSSARAAAPEVGDLAMRFLADCDRRVEARDLAPITRDSYRRRLKSFIAACGATRADAIRPRDVAAWLDARSDWGPTSRHDGVAAVKQVFDWALKMGHLDADPLARLEKPRRAERREQVMDADALPRVLGAIRSPRFRDLVDFLYQTGARPGEACRVEAAHLDLARGVAVLAGKSTHRTGRQRTIHLNAAMVALCRRLAAENPVGPIFRNGRGGPWTKDAINNQVCRIRARAGLGREVIAYALRHIFVTDALEKGVPVATVAELAGHASTAMIGRVYSHLADRHGHLKAALGEIRPDASASADTSPRTDGASPTGRDDGPAPGRSAP